MIKAKDKTLSLLINGFKINVEEVSEKELPDDEAEFFYLLNLIRVRANMDGQVKDLAIIHEMIHAYFRLHGYDLVFKVLIHKLELNGTPDEIMEIVVQWIAGIIYNLVSLNKHFFGKLK